MALVGVGSSVVNDSGVLVVHRPQGEEVYEITKIPTGNMSLVLSEEEGILKGLSLESILTELNRAGDLLYLAYVGVVGTGELHARISDRQMELSKLCAECSLTMSALEEGSSNVLTRLTIAYKFLLKGNDVRAVKELTKCSAIAEKMATSCERLALGFVKLSDDTQKDASTAARALGDQVTKLRELANLRAKMEANKKKQEVNRKQSEDAIEDLKTQLTEETAREDKASERAFISGLVSGVASALASGLGAGLNAYMASAQPIKINLAQPAPQVPSGGEVASDDRGKLESAEKALEDATSEEAEARETKNDLRVKVVDAEGIKDSKQKRLDAAKAGDKAEAEYEEKVKKAQAELDLSSEKLAELKAEQVKAEKKLEKAGMKLEKANKAKAALHAVAESLKSAGETAGKMSEAEAERAKEIGNYRRELLKQKRDQEMIRRESVGLLAELTSLLESNQTETNVHESSQVALEIASWALNRVFAALSNAMMFWKRMSAFCAKLAERDVIDRITDESSGSAEERLEIYRSEDFVKPTIIFLSKWAALSMVCGKYAKASERARQAVLGNIKASPSIAQAREQVKPLRDRILGEIEEDERQLAENVNDLNERIAEDEQKSGALDNHLKELKAELKAE